MLFINKLSYILQVIISIKCLIKWIRVYLLLLPITRDRQNIPKVINYNLSLSVCVMVKRRGTEEQTNIIK